MRTTAVLLVLTLSVTCSLADQVQGQLDIILPNKYQWLSVQLSTGGEKPELTEEQWTELEANMDVKHFKHLMKLLGFSTDEVAENKKTKTHFSPIDESSGDGASGDGSGDDSFSGDDERAGSGDDSSGDDSSGDDSFGDDSSGDDSSGDDSSGDDSSGDDSFGDDSSGDDSSGDDSFGDDSSGDDSSGDDSFGDDSFGDDSSGDESSGDDSSGDDSSGDDSSGDDESIAGNRRAKDDEFSSGSGSGSHADEEKDPADSVVSRKPAGSKRKHNDKHADKHAHKHPHKHADKGGKKNKKWKVEVVEKKNRPIISERKSYFWYVPALVAFFICLVVLVASFVCRRRLLQQRKFNYKKFEEDGEFPVDGRKVSLA